ncbi:MAG: DUF2079 domain-containing protein, partial [Patescibacteria group bacterium]
IYIMKWKLTGSQIIWLMIAAYIAVFGLIASLRHYNFQTQTWDLTAFVQTFWNAAHGRGLVNNVEQVHNHLGLHMSPWLFLLAPGYALFQTPYYLLIIQTIAIALGALPLYFLAKRVLNNQLLSRVIAAAYLLYPGLQWANLYDFHEITFFVPLLLAAIYFSEARKWGWAALFFTLAASVKEDAILVVFFAGIYLLLKKSALADSRKTGIVIAVAALVYFILAVKVFMPAFGGGVLRFDRYANLGQSPLDIVKNAAANPLLIAGTALAAQKLIYLFWLFLPVAFLPLFSWRSLILLAPGLAENLLTNYKFQFSGLYHYDAILIPGIFVGVVYGAEFLLRNWPKKEKIIFWLLAASMSAGFLIRSPLGPAAFPKEYFQFNQTWEDYRKLAALVPDGLTVAAVTNLVPHLSHREHIYQLGNERFLVDIVLIDTNDLFGFGTAENLDSYIAKYMKTGMYNMEVFNNRYVILLHKKFSLTAKS